MKKILLSCVTCLLAVGLLAACDEEVEDVTPEDPNAGVVEPGENDGGSTEKGEDFLPVLGAVTAGDYFLGIEVSEVPYYFDGEVYQSYYGEVSEHGYEAVVVTVAEVTGGYTLSFADSDEATQYIQMAENDTHRNFVWGDDPYVWSYDTTFETFVALDSEGVYYYMGTYGTYKEMAMNAYSYLEEGASTSAQYPAHLYEVITYNAPESVTISGAENVESLEEGETLQLTATVSGTDPVNGKITWTSSDDTAATVSSTGLVTAKSPADSVTITATSAVADTVSDSVTFAITQKTQGPVLADWQTDVDASTEATYKLAFIYSGGLRYADGHDAGGNYTYEGLTTPAFAAGADISVSKVDEGSENEYYLTFYLGDVEYWITIVEGSSNHINLSYSTTAASIYYNATYNCWGDESGEHYLGAYYYSNGNEVYLYSQAISDITASSKLPAELYEWTGEEYGDYEVADFDALSSTGYEDTYSQNSKGENSGYTILTGTTYEGFTACDIKWPEYKSGGSDVNNTRVNSNRYIQFYGSDTMTLTLKDSYTITRIEIACTVGYSRSWSIALDSADATTEGISIEGDLVTITGTEEVTESITLKNTNGSQARIRDIVVYYEVTE